MQNVTIILIALAVLGYASFRSRDKTRRSRFQHLKGWQKMFGVLAVILALLMFLNPEFLALGLIGDTAFFDMFVLALGLQMHRVVARASRACIGAVSRSVQWLGIPSPGMLYLLFLLMTSLTCTVAAFQKAVHRIFS